MLSFFHISGSIHPWNKKNRQLFKSQNAKGNKVCALFHATTYGIIKFHSNWFHTMGNAVNEQNRVH